MGNLFTNVKTDGFNLEIKRLYYAASPDFSPGGEMIAQDFGMHKEFCEGAEYGLYFQLSKISCAFQRTSEGASIW